MQRLKLVPRSGIASVAPAAVIPLGQFLRPGPLPLLHPDGLRRLNAGRTLVPTQELIRAIEFEPFLLARLVALANSLEHAVPGEPAFATRDCLNRVGTVHALDWLCEQDWNITRRGAPALELAAGRLRGTALVMRYAVARYPGLGGIVPGLAYVAGLLHQCAVLLPDCGLGDFCSCAGLASPCLDELCNWRASRMLVSRLGLPPVLRDVLSERGPGPAGDAAGALACLLRLVACTQAGDPALVRRPQALRCLALLGWQDGHFQRLRADWSVLSLRARLA